MRACSVTWCCAPSWRTDKAQVAGHSMQAELELLCTHGILHLLGFDHAEPAEETEMFGLQRDLLASWQSASVARPRPPRQRRRSRTDDAGDVLLPGTAVVLIVLAGMCAAADAALSRVSRVHVDDYLRDNRRGAVAIAPSDCRAAALSQRGVAVAGCGRDDGCGHGRHLDHRSVRPHLGHGSRHRRDDDRRQLCRRRCCAAHARAAACRWCRAGGGAGRDAPGQHSRAVAAAAHRARQCRDAGPRLSRRSRSPARPNYATWSTSPRPAR